MLNLCSPIQPMVTLTKTDAAYYQGETPVFNTCVIGDNQNHPYLPWSGATIDGYFYSILHEVVRREESSGRGWKNFEHYKAYRSACVGGVMPIYTEIWDFVPHVYEGKLNDARSGICGFTQTNDQVLPCGEPGLPVQGLTGFLEYGADGSIVPPPANLGQLIQSSLNSMLPYVKAELSILNSLHELKDFKSLIPSIKRAADVAKSVWNRITGRKRPRDTLRRALNSTADGYLQSQFSILPLLSDISGFRRAMSKLNRQVNRLVSEEGRRLRKHYVHTWAEFSNNDTPEHTDWCYAFKTFYSPRPQHSIFRLERKVLHDLSTFHAEMEYNYNYTAYARENARMLAFNDAIGANLNPSIIWNAIPWTFVIDWLVNIGSFLDQFTVHSLEPQINIGRYLWSIKRKRSVYTSKQSMSTYGDVPAHMIVATLPVTTETSYRRQVGGMDINSILTSGLSLKEFSLGAALVTSRRTNPRQNPVPRRL